MPDTVTQFMTKVILLNRVVGSKEIKPNDLRISEKDIVLIHLGTQRTVGICVKPGNITQFMLPKRPLCIKKGDKVSFSKQINKRWRLIGYGIVQ